MRDVLTTYDRVQLSYAQSLLRDAGIETQVLDGSLNVYESLMWQAFRLMVLDDRDVEKAELILRDGLANWTPQDPAGE